MIHHLLRRIPVAAATLLLATLVVYGLLRAMPGEPAALRADPGDLALSPSAAAYEEMRREMGLDRHWLLGYGQWLLGLARGDLGKSLTDRAPVTDVIGPRMGPTLLLAGTSLFLTYLLAIPLGLWCGARPDALSSRTIGTVLYMLYSLPAFVAALFLLDLLAVRLDWLPLSGMHGPDEAFNASSLPGKAWDMALHMVLPVACFTYGSLAWHVRFIRANLQDALRQDYIRTARAKGLGEMAVVGRHAFRNTLVPLVTHLGLTLPALLGGSVILERIFSWPGLGNLLFMKVLERDHPVIMALVLLYAVLVIAGNLLADLLYAVVDPRIRTP